MGLKPETKEIQIDSIDIDLRNSLWNLLRIYLFDTVSQQKKYGQSKSDFQLLCLTIWHNYYKLPIDKIPNMNYECIDYIRSTFFNYSWDEVYDFVEFTCGISVSNFDNEDFIEDINKLLISEFSGYRIIGGKICPIISEIEIKEISSAIIQHTAYEGANIHITNAIAKLSDKKNPDYSNSIKESISALGSIIRLLTGESTFGNALKNLSSKGVEIDVNLLKSLEKIYAYTNNKDGGIRHEIVDEYKSPDFDDAKLMLVLCCSYINYIISKSTT
jgi:hypothetical protein